MERTSAEQNTGRIGEGRGGLGLVRPAGVIGTIWVVDACSEDLPELNGRRLRET